MKPIVQHHRAAAVRDGVHDAVFLLVLRVLHDDSIASFVWI
jgi:hypothetical protein